jgi:hypothetical protein
MTVSPNPRLKRTRSALLRWPLSRKPVGDESFGRSVWLACAEPR